MSFITFQCYACGKGLKVPLDKAGRKAKCNQCGTVLTIPAQSTEPTPPAAPPTPMASPTPSGLAAQPYGQPMMPAAPAQEQAYEPAFADFVQQPAPGGYPQHLAQPSPTPGGYPPQPAPGYPAPGGYPPQPAPGFPAPSGFNQFSPTHDEEYVPEPTGPAGPPKWNFVRLGFLLVFIGACVMAGGYALHVIGWLIFSVSFISSNMGMGNTWLILLGVCTILSLCGTIAATVGYVFCLLGPNRKGSFGMCIAVLAVAGVEMLFVMIFQLPNQFSMSSYVLHTQLFTPWFFLLLIQLLFGTEQILFCLIVRALALSLHKKQSAKSALPPLYLVAGYTGLRFLTFLFFYIGATIQDYNTVRVLNWMWLILVWLGIAAFIGFILMYTLFLWKMRNLIPAK